MSIEQNLLQLEIIQSGQKVRIAAENLIGDQRVRNFTAPDHIEVLLKLIDPSGHEAKRDPGISFVYGMCVSDRVLNYARFRRFPQPFDVNLTNLFDILSQAKEELNFLQEQLISAVRQGGNEAETYLKALTHFSALYFALDRPSLRASVDYLTPFREKVVIRGFSSSLFLGPSQLGIVEIAPGLRGIASINKIHSTGTPLVLVDINPYVTGLLEDYSSIRGATNVVVKQEDGRTTDLMMGKGSIIITGIHHLSDDDIMSMIQNVARSIPDEGRMYFRDSEKEKPGMRGVVESAINKFGLEITHSDSYPEKQGFEFVARKK